MFFNGFPPVCFGVVALIIAGKGDSVNVVTDRFFFTFFFFFCQGMVWNLVDSVRFCGILDKTWGGRGSMEAEGILKYCLENLEGSVLVESWGEKGIFYNPGRVLKRGVYILTVKEKDGDNDKGSRLDRPGVYRVNLGVRKDTFVKLFGAVPKRPGAGGVVEMDYDFSAADCFLPHPVYAWMGWMCVLNPSEETFEDLKPYIREAYEYAKEKFAKRK